MGNKYDPKTASIGELEMQLADVNRESRVLACRQRALSALIALRRSERPSTAGECRLLDAPPSVALH